MNKKETYFIGNLAYTLEINEDIHKELKRFLNISDNNETKNLLAGFITLARERQKLEKELEKITLKLSKINLN